MTNRSRLAVASAVLSGILLLTWTGISQAKTRVAWMTTKAMASKIHGFVPQIPTNNTSAPSVITATTCHGLGKAHRSRAIRKYSRFRCTATWAGGNSRVWARALPGRKFCASSTGLAACPAAPPLAGDPRICLDPHTPPNGDPNRCALSATEAAVLRAMKVAFNNPDWEPGNLHCKGSNLKRTCTFQQLNVFGVYYASKIRFAVKDGAWTATLATTGGQGPWTCTVLPNPNTAAGKPSKWRTGPTPTCS
jgi:hypothetical protein